MQLSEDGLWMWDGTQWITAQQPPASQTMGYAIPQQPVALQQQVPMVSGLVQPSMQHFQPQGMAANPIEEESGRKMVPWIGVALIAVSMFLPYISILGFNVSGFDILIALGDYLDMGGMSGGDSGSSGGDSDIGFAGTMFAIAILMLALSPIIYLLSAIGGSILLGMKKSPKILTILHLGYFVIFIIVANLGSIDIGIGDSWSVMSFVGFGFYLGSLSPGLWFVNK